MSEKKEYDFLIVGAGIYGATIAYLLKQIGKKCLVIDKRPVIGGNLYTENIEGINVHRYGAHIFHTSNKEVWKFVNQFAEFNNYVNSPIAIFKDEVYNLPFNMNTFSKIFNECDPEKIKNLIEQDKDVLNRQPNNLKEQAISLVGKKIYAKLIEGYTEKQWGRKCTDLPASIIKRLPLRFTFNNNYFNDRWQGIPIGGYTQMIQKMLDGIDIVLNVDFKDCKETYSRKCEAIIYTGQIDQFFDYCYGPLQYRSLRFVTEVVDMPNFQGNAVVNYTDVEPKYTRIIEHKHFEAITNDEVYSNSKTVVTKEYSQEWQDGMEPYYPVNDEANAQKYSKYKELAIREHNVYFGGRLAEYKYYDMDKTIESAMSLFSKICVGEGIQQ